MAVDPQDQPRGSYFDYDVSESGYDMSEPYVPPRRGIGAAEVLSFVLIVALCVPIISWFAMRIAELLA